MMLLYRYKIKAYNKYTTSGAEHDIVTITVPMALNEETAINEAQVMVKRDVYEIFEVGPIVPVI